MSSYTANCLLLIVAMIWGSTFTLIKDALLEMGPATFSAIRFGLGSVLLVCLRPRAIARPSPLGLRAEAIVGLGIGACLGAGYWFQTTGLETTTAGKAGFLTGLYVVAVPILAWLFWRERVTRLQATGIGVALVGLGLLTLHGDFSLVIGDIWVTLAALTFAVQILGIDRYGSRANPTRLTLWQLLGVTIVCGVVAFLAESPTGIYSEKSWLILAFVGFIATTLAFLVQAIAQPRTTSIAAGLAMASEALWAAVFGWLWAGERLSAREGLGGLLLLCAMILVQWPTSGRAVAKSEGGLA